MATKYPLMNWQAENVPETFKIFKQKLLLVCEDNEIQEPTSIAWKIKIGLDDEGLRRLNASTLTEKDKKLPAKIWKFFEDQLRVSVNFRIHRLSLMQYRQKEGESLDEFITRTRILGQQCEFTEAELQERIIKLVIASTPMEPFRRELLGKDSTFTLEDLITEGRKHEAVSKGTRQLETLYQQQIHTVSHPRSQLKPCGNMGHWQGCCRKMKGKERDNKHQPKQHHRRRHHKKQVHNIYEDSEDDTSDDSSSQNSYTANNFSAIDMGNKCLDVVSQEDTAFTILDIQLPHKPGIHTMQVKLDSGATANALPLRSLRLMYPTQKITDVVQSISTTKLTSYSGDDIKCVGTLSIRCRYRNDAWYDTLFHVVDVTGPIILGLPACERLNLISIKCERITVHNISTICSV